MPCYALEGMIPVVHPTAFVHETAVLLGDVNIGPGCYVGPCASLRGDFGRVVIAAGANVQDNCTLHSFPGREVTVEEEGHVGHGAVLHGCMIGRNALIGINAVIMDNVTIGHDAFIAAMSFVASNKAIAPATLWAGVPARFVRDLRPDEVEWKSRGTREYQELATRCLKDLRPCQPLSEAEPSRRENRRGHVPFAEWRAKIGKG